MASKEVMVSAPLIVLLYDRIFFTGSFGETLRRRWGLYLALAATWLVLGRSLGEAVGAHAVSAGFNLPQATPLEYARSEFGVILHYLRLAFLPVGLCLDYDWPIAKGIRDIVPGAVVVGGLLAATVWALGAAADVGIRRRVVLSGPGAHLEHHADPRPGVRAPDVPAAGGADCAGDRRGVSSHRAADAPAALNPKQHLGARAA